MLSGIITIVLLVLFIGCWIWAWRPARKKDFDAAARLALDETDKDGDTDKTDLADDHDETHDHNRDNKGTGQ